MPGRCRRAGGGKGTKRSYNNGPLKAQVRPGCRDDLRQMRFIMTAADVVLMSSLSASNSPLPCGEQAGRRGGGAGVKRDPS